MGPSDPYDNKLHSIGIDLKKIRVWDISKVWVFKFILFQFDPTLYRIHIEAY